MSELSTTGEPRRRRAEKGPTSGASALRNERYREIINPLRPAQLFSADQVGYIHQASLSLLEQRGLRVLSDRARTCFAQAGADVDGHNRIVRLDAGLVTQALALAPRIIRIVALKEDCYVTVGGQRILITPVVGPPNVSRGHFFGSAHTRERFRSAFHSPMVSDWRNFGTWKEDGAKSAEVRANAVWKKALAEYSPPEPRSCDSRATECVRRKTSVGGGVPVS